MADLEWNKLDQRFEYLSRTDSELYAEVKDSLDPKDEVIKSLLERIARSSRAAHRESRY
jgi:hypothetical protein